MPFRIQSVLFFALALNAFGQSRTVLSSEIQSHLATAQQAQASQDYSTAEKEYEIVLKLAPAFAEVHMNLGLVRQLEGRESDAMAAFLTAVKLKPTLTGANFLLGVDYCKQGNGAAALPYLKSVVAQQPQQVQFLSWLATAQDLTSQWQDEVATLHRALKLQPRNVDLLYLLGQAYERMGKKEAADLKKLAGDSARGEQLVAESYSSSNEWPSAVIHFENAISRSPKMAGLHVELGEVYLHAGRVKLAASEFEKELEAHPNNLRALVRRGEVELVQNQTEAALNDWQKAIAIDPVQVRRILGMREAGFGDAAFEQLPTNLRAHLDHIQGDLTGKTTEAADFTRAFLTFQEGEPAASTKETVSHPRSCSISEITKLLQDQRYTEFSLCSAEVSRPQFPVRLRIQAAAALVAADNYDSALQVLNSLPTSERKSSEASYWRARSYEKLATAAYLKMYEVDPDSYRVHQLLGDLAATRNDDAAAIEEYRTAVKINPQAPNLHYSLGHILWKDLNIPEARVQLEAELKINPRHSGALHDMGDTFLQEHQPEKALPYLNRAVAADPANPDVHRDLGTAYTQLKEYVKAVPEYKIGIENDDDGSVHYKLAKVYQAMGQKQNADHEFALYSAMNQQSHEKLEKRGQRLADIERTAE